MRKNYHLSIPKYSKSLYNPKFQTETNCEMYRAVMEEVARFFERYQLQQQLQQTQRNGEQIARSKSLHHVHGVGNTSLQSDARDDDASSGGSQLYILCIHM